MNLELSGRFLLGYICRTKVWETWNSHLQISAYLEFRFTRLANYTSKFMYTRRTYFTVQRNFLRARVSEKARAVCACIMIGNYQSCDIAISVALCATYATRQYAGAKSARRFPRDFAIYRKKLAHMVGTREIASWIQTIGLW